MLHSDHNIIPEMYSEESGNSLISGLSEMLISWHSSPGKLYESTLYDVCKTSGMDDQIIHTFIRAYIGRKENGRQFWKELSHHRQLRNSENINKFKTCLILDKLTDRNIPIMKHVFEMLHGSEIACIEDLVRMAPDSWQKCMSGMEQSGERR